MTREAKQRCKAILDELRLQFIASGQAAAVLRERASVVDTFVQECFAETLGAAMAEGVALLAVGGYGRRELFPHSDVDLLILVRRPPEDPAAKEALSEFLRALWDGGLRLSHSVRTLEETCKVTEGNFELTVSLLDERLLAGDRSLYALMRERFAKFLQAERRDLVRRLCRMTRSRQARFHNTIYRLEPDIKEAPGGLRDLQSTRWLRTLRGEAPDVYADPRPLEFLFSVRCFLHFNAGRDQNLLSFELQDAIVASGITPVKDPEQWMRAFFRHAAAVYREALSELETSEAMDRSLMSNFRDWRSRLSNSEFTVSRDLLFVRNPHDLDVNTELPLRLFLFVARHGVRAARQTEKRITAHLFRWSKAYSDKPPGMDLWRQLLSLPHTGLALRTMAATGFLGTLLPEWDRIEHLVVRDFYHQYTVDEHTIVALESIQDLMGAADGGAGRFKELLIESGSDVWLLKLALLLHDIGKGSGRDHSTEAVALARVFLRRSNITGVEADTVSFLIEHHLALNAILQGKDVHDPATARAAAAQVKTVERLRLLTLLSYADVTAVNASAMTPWRMEQLWRLYRVVHRELTGNLSEERVETPAEAYGDASPLMAEFLDGLPARYLWTHDRKQAEVHAALYAKSKESGASIQVERSEGVFVLTVVTMDRPFLFASLAGALASFGLNILKAEAFANGQGYVIDSFAFADPTRSLELNPPEIERLRTVVRKVAVGETRAEDLLKHRPAKPLPGRRGALEPNVTADPETSAAATIFEVVAQDRPGLLYSLATAISRSGADIDVVLVDTEAHRAIDVFHVTIEGRKLDAEECERVRAAMLAACPPGA